MPCCAIRNSVLALVLLALSGVMAQASASCSLPLFENATLLRAMQRGVNLTGWDAADPARRPTRRQLEALRADGLTHIRLPLDPRRLDGAGAGDYRAAIGTEVKRLLGLNYAVSLDLHAGSEIGALARRDPQAAARRLAFFWAPLVPLVRRFDPSRVAVELLNEPEMAQDVWMAMARRLIENLRAELPKHSFIVGPSGPQRHETLGDMRPFEDRNIVYAIHYYDPFAFTHQGLTWGAGDDPLRLLANLPFPVRRSDAVIEAIMADLIRKGRPDAAQALADALDTPWDGAMIEVAFDVMARWSHRYGRPVIVNEFGVLTFVAPRASRLDWLASVSRSARQRCIGWTHWEFQDGFGLIDPRTHMPDAGVMDALTGAVTP